MTKEEMYQLEMKQLEERYQEKALLEERLEKLKKALQMVGDREQKMVQEHYISSEIIDFVKEFGFVPDSALEMEQLLSKESRSTDIDRRLLSLSITFVLALLIFPQIKAYMIASLGTPLAMAVCIMPPMLGMFHHVLHTIKKKKRYRGKEAQDALEQLTKEHEEQEVEIRTIQKEEVELDRSIALVYDTINKVDYAILELRRNLHQEMSPVEEVMIETDFKHLIYVKEENRNIGQKEKNK